MAMMSAPSTAAARSVVTCSIAANPCPSTSMPPLDRTSARRLSGGLQLVGNYRWSKSIDQLSYEGPGFVTNQTFPQNNRTERGPSDFDVRHQFVLFGLWDLPIARGQHGFLGKALGGWQINGAFTAHSAFPWTPQEGCCFFGTPGGAANDINGDGIGNDFPTQWDGQGGLGTSNQAFINGFFRKTQVTRLAPDSTTST